MRRILPARVCTCPNRGYVWGRPGHRRHRYRDATVAMVVTMAIVVIVPTVVTVVTVAVVVTVVTMVAVAIARG